MLSASASICCWFNTTPLGFPVVPLVYTSKDSQSNIDSKLNGHSGIDLIFSAYRLSF